MPTIAFLATSPAALVAAGKVCGTRTPGEIASWDISVCPDQLVCRLAAELQKRENRKVRMPNRDGFVPFLRGK